MMKFICAILATVAHIAIARPQYNYPAPSGIFNGGSGISTGGNLGSDGIFGGSTLTGTGGGINTGIGGGGGTLGGGGIIGGGNLGGGIGGGGLGGGGGIGGGNLGGGGGIGGGAIGGGGTLIQKHIYVHVAPPEPEEFRPQRPISVGQATKHYKIIFIKAPSAPAPTPQQIALAAQNQEKTIVYVLVKKPEEAADITVPTAAPTQPSKPEVYFIRYKSKTESTGSATNIGTSGSSVTGGGNIGGLIGNTGGSSITTGGSSDSTSSLNIRPSTQYGPPGQSGPY